MLITQYLFSKAIVIVKMTSCKYYKCSLYMYIICNAVFYNVVIVFLTSVSSKTAEPIEIVFFFGGGEGWKLAWVHGTV